MTSRDLELLAAIRADPDDDAPRLVYADLLSERGDPRGEFIHLQLDRANADEVREGREKLLLASHAGEWATASGLTNVRVKYRRGFPYAMSGDVRGVYASRAALAALPITELALTVDAQASFMVKLAGAPELGGIRSLRLDAPPYREADRAKPLLESHALGQLRALAIKGPVLEDARSAALASAPWFPQLERLELVTSGFTEASLGRLLDRAPALTELDLRHQRLRNGGVDRLVRLQARLRSLWLEDCQLTSRDAIALFGAPLFDSIEKLVLGNDPLGGCTGALASSPHAFALRTMNLFSCQLVPDDAVALANAANLRDLTELGLANNSIGAVGARALAASTTLRSLTTLYLTGNALGAGGIAALASRAGLPALTKLGVFDTMPDEPWAETRARFAHAAGLTVV